MAGVRQKESMEQDKKKRERERSLRWQRKKKQNVDTEEMNLVALVRIWRTSGRGTVVIYIPARRLSFCTGELFWHNTGLKIAHPPGAGSCFTEPYGAVPTPGRHLSAADRNPSHRPDGHAFTRHNKMKRRPHRCFRATLWSSRSARIERICIAQSRGNKIVLKKTPKTVLSRCCISPHKVQRIHLKVSSEGWDLKGVLQSESDVFKYLTPAGAKRRSKLDHSFESKDEICFPEVGRLAGGILLFNPIIFDFFMLWVFVNKS